MSKPWIAEAPRVRDFNYADPIQAYGELYFKNLFGYDRQLSACAGRFAFELLDPHRIDAVSNP